MSISGSFEDEFSREVVWEVQEIHTNDGEVRSPDEVNNMGEDYLREADRVFYTIDMGGETFYRWVAGPFEGESDVEQAIIDEQEAYA